MYWVILPDYKIIFHTELYSIHQGCCSSIHKVYYIPKMAQPSGIYLFHVPGTTHQSHTQLLSTNPSHIPHHQGDQAYPLAVILIWKIIHIIHR